MMGRASPERIALRQHDAPDASDAVSGPDQRNRPPGYASCQRITIISEETEQEKQKPVIVYGSRSLVIDREHVLAPEPQFLVRMIVHVPAQDRARRCHGRHFVQRRTPWRLWICPAFPWIVCRRHKRRRCGTRRAATRAA